MKRITTILLTILLTLSLVACGSAPAANTPAPANDSAGAPAADTPAADAPAQPEVTGMALPYPSDEKIKVGFVTFDSAGDQFLAIQNYLNYLSQSINIEVIYSESIDSAEGELAFIESCAAAGCKAIIAYYNVARNEAVQLAIDKGMYYYGVAEEDDVYNAFKDNPMYLGGIYNGNADYDSCYNLGKAMIDAGCTKLVFCSGGRDFGIKMFIDRSDGFYAAVEEAKAAGKDVEVVKDISGWPGTDAFSSDQAAALDMDLDGVVSTFGCGMWLQPIFNSGKADSVKLAAVDSLIPDFVDAFKSGLIAAIAVEPTATLALGAPMAVNAVTGWTVRDNSGVAPRLPCPRLVITTGEDYEAYVNFETTGTWMYNGQDILSMIKGYNPDATYDSICDLVNAVSVEEINARRAAQ